MLNDPEYLRNKQYASNANLEARIDLHARFSTNPYGWFHWLFDQLSLPSSCRLLELGCGSGRFWLENLERVPRGWNILLTDFSAGMLRSARQNLESRLPHAAFRVVDAQSIPLPDRSVDCVFASHMLYHVLDRQKALAEIVRVLTPEGCLAASTVGESHLVELPRLMEKFDRRLAKQQMEWEISFSLENGVVELERYFSQVTLKRYQDGLLVTHPEPLVDYLLSSSRFGFDAERQADFVSFIAREIEQNDGALRITKDSGVFICRNG